MHLPRYSVFILFSSVVLLSAMPILAHAVDKPKELTYEDRALWQSLPVTDIDIAEETFQLTRITANLDSASNRVYLWFNEPADPNDGDALTIQALSASGEVLYLDTAEALFTDRSRMSMRKMDGDFVKMLMQKATSEFEEIVVVTADVGSVPVLRGLHLWQEQASRKERNQLKNVVLLYPSLFVNAPTAGEIPELFPISYQTALPITILQPTQGTQANTIHLTERAFRMGGSLVQTIQVPKATDGYYKYQDIRSMAKDAAQRITQTTNTQIAKVKKINYQVAKLTPVELPIPETKIISGLIKIEPSLTMPSIKLNALTGKHFNVPSDYTGKALLINFWATWCPHCVEEIPSMNRALKQLDADKFAMISISYKDSKALLNEFVKEVQVDFPILLDLDGKVSEQWNIFAFPSSFLVDANGQIRYSINAGSIWDSPEMLDYLKEVMKIPYKPKTNKEIVQ